MSPLLSATSGGRGAYAPKYVGVARRLIEQISADGLQPGDRLGTELQIAREHGVSRVTVRQALAILQDEGYILRKKARGTFVRKAASGQRRGAVLRGTVLVVCSNEQASHLDEDVGFAAVLRAMERTFAQAGCMVQIVGVGTDEAAELARVRRLTARGDVTGICSIGPCLEPFEPLLRELPVLQCGGFRAGDHAYVGPDLVAMASTCVVHLLERGHRRIAMLCGPWVQRNEFSEFARGFHECFERANTPCPRHLLQHAYQGEPLDRFVREVLSVDFPPTAVVAENWCVCQAVLTVAAQLGLRIPEELSLIGYGQNVLRLASPVSITSYLPDTERIGTLGASMLVDMLDGKAPPPEPVLLPGELIEGASVCPARD